MEHLREVGYSSEDWLFLLKPFHSFNDLVILKDHCTENIHIDKSLELQKLELLTSEFFFILCFN